MDGKQVKTRGGARAGAGRPKGSVSSELSNARPQHQLRATDEEWELIRQFAALVKHGRIYECRAFLTRFS